MLVFVSGLSLFSLSCAPKVPPPTVGEVVQDFQLADLDGNGHRLSDFRGEVVVLNFWATWCPPCRDELPSLEKLHRSMLDKGIRVVAVSVDERYDDLELMSESYQLTMTVLHDSGKRVSRLYQTFRFPETYIVSPDGVLRSKVVGPRNWIEPNVIRDLVRLKKDYPATDLVPGAETPGGELTSVGSSEGE